MAQHSLQNSLDSTKRESSNIGKQWQDQAQRLHNMANDINSGQEWTKSLSASEKQDVLSASTLSSALGVGFNSTNMSSGASDSINKDLSKVKDISSRLSHSTNQHVSDAFSNSSSLINTSSHNLEQSVATSRALNDMKSNAAGVNSDFTTDWANNLRAQGIDPKAMSTEQQHASATAYANEYLHKQYGIKDDVLKPSTAVSDPTHSKSVSNSGIQDVDHQVQYSLANDQAKMDKSYNDQEHRMETHPAETLGKQIAHHGKVAEKVFTADGKLIGNEEK